MKTSAKAKTFVLCCMAACFVDTLLLQANAQNHGGNPTARNQQTWEPKLPLIYPPKGVDAFKFWNGWSWNNLYRVEQKLWETLGWNQEMWDNRWKWNPKFPTSNDKRWSELTPAEREAATQLGFTEASWRPRTPRRVAWVSPNQHAPEGSQFKTFHSDTINEPASYLIYLPEEYEKFPEKRYPVVYCIPGGDGGEALSGLVRRLKQAIKSGQAAPMIVVNVTAIPGVFYWDPPSGELPLESVIVNDLLRHIDASYRTVARREGRALHGGSMGGMAALYFGLKYPEKFGAVSSFSAAFFIGPESSLVWAAKNADAVRGRTRIQMVCGTQDDLFEAFKILHGLLERLDITHEYSEVEAAGHQDVWTKVTDHQALGFFVEAFRSVRAQNP